MSYWFNSFVRSTAQLGIIFVLSICDLLYILRKLQTLQTLHTLQTLQTLHTLRVYKHVPNNSLHIFYAGVW